MITTNEASKPKVIRTIGGPSIKHPPDAILEPVAFTLQGLLEMEDLQRPDIITYWPSAGLFGGIALLNELRHALEILQDGRVDRLWGMEVGDHQPASVGSDSAEAYWINDPSCPAGDSIGTMITQQLLYLQAVDPHPVSDQWPDYKRITGLDHPSEFAERLIHKIMWRCFRWAQNGSTVIAVVPNDLMTCGDDSNDTRLFRSAFSWISSLLTYRQSASELQRAIDVKRLHLAGAFAEHVGSCSRIQFMQSAEFDLTITDAENNARSVTQSTLKHDQLDSCRYAQTAYRYAPRYVRIGSAVVNQDDKAVVLVITYGRGGFLLLPEPISAQDIVGALCGEMRNSQEVLTRPKNNHETLVDACDEPLSKRLPEDQETITRWNSVLRFRPGAVSSIQAIAAYVDEMPCEERVASNKAVKFRWPDGSTHPATPESVKKKLDRRIPSDKRRDVMRGMELLPEKLKDFLVEARHTLISRMDQNT